MTRKLHNSTACDITEKGFRRRRLLSFLKPGIWEYELKLNWFTNLSEIDQKVLHIPNHCSGIMPMFYTTRKQSTMSRLEI